MESIDNENLEYDWSDIKPSESDSFQFYVFVAHALLGIIISVLSFSGGWVSWGVGIGALTPVLLVLTGVVYSIPTGIDWYRNEFIPHLTRIQMIPEFETDRFLKYQRISRATMLLSGYLALVVTQWVWTQITTIIMSFTGNLGDLLEALGFIFIGMIVLHLIVTIFFFGIFHVILRSIFSDVRYIVEIEEKMTKYFKEKKKDEEEESDEAEANN
ncbi:MAG: hypothetical protein RTV41_06485 [Candidatus Thorarchaeota archaeon]